ncbi:hypothetical protein HUK38_06925 [Thiospirillum jenense]|uniref:Uncharacterized protein n=1 Tax=Thiospirillum jenense TaxID=1653858 RepID=A0A839HIT1_9GAMM|nr:hypothetical protein [Thiospirillum jenense]
MTEYKPNSSPNKKPAAQFKIKQRAFSFSQVEAVGEQLGRQTAATQPLLLFTIDVE